MVLVKMCYIHDMNEGISEGQKNNKSKFFWPFWKKRIKFLGFHNVVIVKSFPLMYQLLM